MGDYGKKKANSHKKKSNMPKRREGGGGGCFSEGSECAGETSRRFFKRGVPLPFSKKKTKEKRAVEQGLRSGMAGGTLPKGKGPKKRKEGGAQEMWPQTGWEEWTPHPERKEMLHAMGRRGCFRLKTKREERNRARKNEYPVKKE